MKSIENKTSFILDLFFCIVFMPILLILGPARYWIVQWPVFFVICCVFMYGCYFAILRLNIPGLLIDRRYGRIACVIAGFILANYLLSHYPLPDMEFVTPTLSEFQTQVRNFGVSVVLWLMFSLVMGYSLTISFVKELYEQLLLKKKIEVQRDRAELAMFKAQISPHFLFNTLNSLYCLVIGTSERAEDAFIKFTEILKYTYITIEKEKVPLKDEIDYISNYIDLQKIRLNEHTRVEWNWTVDDEGVLVPPMLMLTFVENAFKYGASTSNDCSVSISLRLENGRLEFVTRNSVMKHADEFRKEMPVGIENCRARLSSLFPDRHSLSMEEVDGVFTLSLNIQLNRYE